MGQTSLQIRRGVSFGNRIFSPGLIPTLVTILLLCLMINLGFWQLRRAEFKEHMVERLAERSQLSSATLTDISEISGDINDFPIDVTGQYLNQFNLLLDNRTHRGVAGYHVLTPLLINNSILLVNRGWIPQGASRSIFPSIPKREGTVHLSGLAHVPNPDFFVLKEDNYSQISWPFLIQKIDLEKSNQLFNYPLLPFVLRLNPEPESGFVRQWHSNFMGPEKHYGYALQWFSLSAALLVIYLVVNTHKKQQEKQ